MIRSVVTLAVSALLASATFAAEPSKSEGKPKRNATVERVKLVGVGGLLDQEAVRKDIGLTKGQLEQMNESLEKMEKQLKALDTASRAAQQKGNLEVTDMQRMADEFADCVLEYDDAIQKQLTADQVYRLKQIQLQRDGPNALLGRHAVRELALTAEQEDKIAETLKKLNKPKVADFTLSAAVAPEEPRIARFLTTYSAELDTTRDEALKHLTTEQKARWKEMTGEEVATICLLIASPNGFMFRHAYKMAK